MYRKEIEEYIDSHKDQMIEDICTLCRINSEKMPYTEGKPFGEGPFEVLQTALTMMENYGFSVRNYDNYVLKTESFMAAVLQMTKDRLLQLFMQCVQ